MRHYLIKPLNCIVSDAEWSAGDYVYIKKYNIVRKAVSSDEDVAQESYYGYHKVLFSNQPLEGLKPFELVNEVEELAEKHAVLKNGGSLDADVQCNRDISKEDFIAGYKAKAGYTEEEMIGFAEWISRNLWHQYGSGKDNLPAFKVEDWSGYWYNTINIKEMRKPLTSKELLTIYLKEQDSKLIEVIQIEDNKFKLKL